jgi:hypothetical protein
MAQERVQLTRHVTEGNIVPLVANTCDRLVSTPSPLLSAEISRSSSFSPREFEQRTDGNCALDFPLPDAAPCVHVGVQTLAPHYREVCLQLTRGKLLDDIAWLGKVHSESVVRKAKAEQAFPDKLCEEIDWCKAYVDPEKLREKQAQETMEAVFF